MSKELIVKVLIQLQPELAKEFAYAMLEDEKKLKALDIIKEKLIDMGELLWFFNENMISLEEYNDGIAKYPITPEEMLLLKEVLS